MKYLGSKNRIAKQLLKVILPEKKPDQWWVEPFVGGGNMIDKVEGKRIGADSNEYLIEALKLIRDNPETIPDLITEEDYEEAKQLNKIDGLSGFIGFAMSFGGKWFGGYRRDVAGTKGCIENMKTQSRRAKQSALKQSKGLQGVRLITSGYRELKIPASSLIYCDPPYAKTTRYKDAFDHADFWQWCRDRAKEEHTVFVSEYVAPEDFECVWQKELANTLTKSGKGKVGVEKLFKYKG